MNDASPTPAPKGIRPAIARAALDMDKGLATVTFANNAVLTVSVDEIKSSKVTNLLDELALMGFLRDITSAYGAHRDDISKAVEAAQKRKADILSTGRAIRGMSTGPTTALDAAIETVAELKGVPVENIRAVVMGFAPKVEGDVTVSPDDQRKRFVTKVKQDPTTAATYAAKRAKALAPKAPTPSVLDSF